MGNETFIPKAGSRVSRADALIIGREITALERRHGEITPESLLDTARGKGHPLHRFFEWDDTSAAAAYRLDQARKLIRSIEIVIEHDNKPPVHVRAFVHIDAQTDDAEDSGRYVGTIRAMTAPDLRQQVVDRALGELESWRRRYEAYAELATIFRAIDSVKSKALPKKRARAVA